MGDPKPTINLKPLEDLLIAAGHIREEDRLTTDPTIRIESCRADGRCPECLEDRSSYAKPPAPSRHPCGCACCGDWRCFGAHVDDLLAEALRQLSDQREQRQMDREFLGFPGEDGVKPARAEYAPEMDTLDTLAYVGTCAAAWEPRVRLLGNAQAGDIVAACLAVKALREERDAAIRQVEEQRHPCPCGKDTASIKWARCYSCRQKDMDDVLEVGRLREERDAAIRERDEARSDRAEALRARDVQHGLRVEAEVRISEQALRADRAEALLRETAHDFGVILTERDANVNQIVGINALLRECDKELAEICGAVADLLCDPAWVVLHNHGWKVLKERRPKIEALIAKIREFLA